LTDKIFNFNDLDIYITINSNKIDTMIEVEVKARIDSFEEMEKRLKDLGAVKTKDEFQEDIYFASPIVDFAETDEALRIRTTNNDTFITYKGPKLNEKAKTRKEVEMTIESAAKASDIFTEIGFTPARTVRKSRQYYRYENFEISLDDVEGLPPYMEIEIALNDSEDYTEAQNRIFKLFEKLDITDGFERTSYMELLENLNTE
jgi:adenylate cyclase class 2